jgi:hypothetical protein
MTKKTKIALWIGIGAVVLYFGYRWYQSKQTNTANNGITSGLGTNLSSVNPLTGVSDYGNESGLNYYGGPITIDVTNPVTPPKTTTPAPKAVTPPKKQPVTTKVSSTNSVTSRTVAPQLNSSPHSISNKVVRKPVTTTAKPAKKAKT